MSTFVDPRTDPTPSPGSRESRCTSKPECLEALHRMCRQGQLYEVERWIQDGNPLQLERDVRVRGRRWKTAMEIALDTGNHALTQLLLCNGYDPNIEAEPPIELALRARRWDLVDMLLEWGADPLQVDPEAVLGTYRTDLIRRFHALGVDYADGHALAEALVDHTSNKPLYGFAKRYGEADSRIRREVDLALAELADKGNLKGILLCIWAGGDPHRSVPVLRWLRRGEQEDDEDASGFSAVENACRGGHVEILERLKPDPALDDFERLYQATESVTVIDMLARVQLPEDVSGLLRHHLWKLDRRFDRLGIGWGSVWTIEHFFSLGVRWRAASAGDVAVIRKMLVRLSDYDFERVLKLLTKADYCAPEILEELGRTPSIRARMKEVGFLPGPPARRGRPSHRPTRSREVLRKLGIELPKPEPWIPRCVHIGSRRPGTKEVRMTRAELLDRVWAEPVVKLAGQWGVSDRGLAKACARIRIPVPPRGYWAKRQAGQRQRRPSLPTLEEGEGEEIVIWMTVSD